MPDAHVLVDHARELVIRVNGSGANFRLLAESIETTLCTALDPVALDLLDISATVFAADSSVARGNDARSNFGAAWRRRFDFRIPVRCPEVWAREDVGQALREAVEFLTDDIVSFAFEAGDDWPPLDDYLDLRPVGPCHEFDEVVLFSGGLDSLAGALETLATGSGRVALVTHRSSQKMYTRQVWLAEQLQKRFPGRVRHIPILATRVGHEASDTTQRSRSLLFAALAHAVGTLLGSSRVSFYENGVISQNLPISSQVIGTMATRTTHPLSLHRIERLLNLVSGTPTRIENRFRWLTKTEVVGKIADLDGTGLIAQTVSCTSIRTRSLLHTHCGACSQCLDRRFAMLAAGLAEHDPAEQYETDVLFGARETDRSRTMALDWTTNAHRLADLSIDEFVTTRANELSRIIRGYPDEGSFDVIRQSHEMQRRHGQAVKSVLETIVARSAAPLLERQIEPTALLSLYLVRRVGLMLPDVAITSPEPPDVNPSTGEPREQVLPLQVSFGEHKGRPWITVAGLGSVCGEPASVPHLLRPLHEEDLRRGCPREAAQFLSTADISRELVISKDAVRKRVQRCHDELADFYAVVEGAPPPHDLLVESDKPRGYRLDPDCRIIAGNGTIPERLNRVSPKRARRSR